MRSLLAAEWSPGSTPCSCLSSVIVLFIRSVCEEDDWPPLVLVVSILLSLACAAGTDFFSSSRLSSFKLLTRSRSRP